VGRYANRIDTGGFVIDGQRHDLTTVHPRTGVHIHGGKTGLHRQVWAATPLPAGVQLTITSPHGHEGYPGDLTVMVSYTLEHGTDLRITYEATTTKPTHLNLTNHAYFHLHPESKQSIRDHRLRLSSDHYLAIDKRKVPTGDLISVANTSFDFRHETRIGDLIERAGGYDHCFIVRGEPGILRHAATLTQAQADLQLNVLTTQPGVQLYTANHRKAPTFPLICFETQHYPDTPNQSTFPTTLLRPDETFQEETVFRLTTTPSRTP
ncbi:MAG: aldose epimerase family protein, partial [Verrucomicrobiota bacterium]